MADDNARPSLEQVTLPDGSTAYKLSNAQAIAMQEILADRIWWQGTLKRARRVGWIAGGAAFVLMGLSMWWPWITRMVQFIIQDVPSS